MLNSIEHDIDVMNQMMSQIITKIYINVVF